MRTSEFPHLKPLLAAKEILRLLYHGAAVIAKRDDTDAAYLYQYLVFWAHGLFG